MLTAQVDMPDAESHERFLEALATTGRMLANQGRNGLQVGFRSLTAFPSPIEAVPCVVFLPTGSGSLPEQQLSS
jgi:hypothetical protein